MINTLTGIAVAVSLASFAFAGEAHAAGPAKHGWGIILQGGSDVPMNGTMHRELSTNIPNFGPLFPTLAGASGDVVIVQRGYDEFYGTSPLARLDVNYALSDNMELFLGASRTEASSDRVQVGTATPTGGAAAPLYARFSDYRATSLELGARVWSGERHDRVRPYVAVRLGATRTDAISSQFETLGAQSIVVPFYNDSTTLSGGVDIGIVYEIARIRAMNAALELGAETGVRFIGDLDQDDSVLSAIGGQGLNERSRRRSAPLTVTLRMRFGVSDD
jgi:hypothetical protein